jgi:hypothetical protein
VLIVDTSINTTRVVIKNAFHYTSQALEVLREGLKNGLPYPMMITIFEPSYDVFDDPDAEEESYAVIVDNPDKIMTFDETSVEGMKAMGNFNFKMNVYPEAKNFYCKGLAFAHDFIRLWKNMSGLSESLSNIGEHSLNLVVSMTIATIAEALKPAERYDSLVEKTCQDFQERLKCYVNCVDNNVEEIQKFADYEACEPRYLLYLMSDHHNERKKFILLQQDVLHHVIQAYANHLKKLDRIHELMSDVDGDSTIVKALSSLHAIDPIASTCLLNSAAVDVCTGHYFEAALASIASTMISNTKPSAKALYRLIKAVSGA